MEKLNPHGLREKTEWLSYSLVDFLNDYKVDLGLKAKEIYFLNQINLYVDNGSLVIDPRSSLIYMDKDEWEEKFVIDILENIIPDKLKGPIYENFDLSSITNVCVYLGFDYYVLDENGKEQSYIDIECLKGANIKSRK